MIEDRLKTFTGIVRFLSRVYINQVFIGAPAVDIAPKSVNVVDALMIQGLADGAAGTIGLSLYNERAWAGAVGGRFIFAVRDTGEFALYGGGTDGIPDGDVLRVTPNVEIVLNDSSKDLNIRIESDGNENMFFVDGGANRVGIGTGSPDYKLEIIGDNNDKTLVHIGDDDDDTGMYLASTQYGDGIVSAGMAYDPASALS